MADLASVEEAASFDLVGGKQAAGGEPVDLLRLAAQNGGELVDGEEDGEGAHGESSIRNRSAARQ